MIQKVLCMELTETQQSQTTQINFLSGSKQYNDYKNETKASFQYSDIGIQCTMLPLYPFLLHEAHTVYSTCIKTSFVLL